MWSSHEISELQHAVQTRLGYGGTHKHDRQEVKNLLRLLENYFHREMVVCKPTAKLVQQRIATPIGRALASLS